MIRNIVFDFGGVLLDLAPERCKAAFRRLGFAEIDGLLGMTHQKGILDAMERGQSTVAAFCDEIRRCLPQAVSDDGILTAWRSMADGIPSFRLDFIAGLKAEGYRVSALSNTNVVHWTHCRPMFLAAGYEPERLFEHVWLSYELQLAKPDPEIFRRILALSGYRPEETLFVDDSPLNCRAAEAEGLRTLTPAMTARPSEYGPQQVCADWRPALRVALG